MASTVKIPFSSTVNVTYIYAVPRGAGFIPSSVNSPNLLLSATIARSPSYIVTLTLVYPSYIVLNVLDFLTGIKLFLSIIGVNKPPTVSTPNVNGVTSISNISLASESTKAAA